MNASILSALVVKDIQLFFKNRFFAFVSVLGLVVYIIIFFLLPSSVDETLELGWAGPTLPDQVVSELVTGGVVFRNYADVEALQEAVLEGDEIVGVSLPQDFYTVLASGGKPQAQIYMRSSVPDEYRSAYTLLLEELGYQIAGMPLQVEAEDVMVGTDMAGQQVPPRQRMLPMMAVFMLMVETWGLAALISAEVEAGTLRALLVTHLNVPGLFISKGVTGILMAFVQAVILVGVTGGFSSEPLLVLTLLLLGSALVTAISFLIAAASRDLMSVMATGMLALIILAIPAFNIVLPGLTTDWIKGIPSYYLVDTLYRVMNFGIGWEEATSSLLILLAFTVAFFGMGVFVLRRKIL